MLDPEKATSFLTKDTMIPLGLAVALIYVAMWSTKISDKVEAHGAIITDYEKTQAILNHRLDRLEFMSEGMAHRLHVEVPPK